LPKDFILSFPSLKEPHGTSKGAKARLVGHNKLSELVYPTHSND